MRFSLYWARDSISAKRTYIRLASSCKGMATVTHPAHGSLSNPSLTDKENYNEHKKLQKKVCTEPCGRTFRYRSVRFGQSRRGHGLEPERSTRAPDGEHLAHRFVARLSYHARIGLRS